MNGLTEGRIVHFCPDRDGSMREHCQAAIVVGVDISGDANLAVFPDGANDVLGSPDTALATRWETSRRHAPELQMGAWHWPQECPR